MAPLRVLNVMLSRGLGGLEQVLLDYEDALALAGHEVQAVIHPGAAIRPALEARGAPWHGLRNLGAWDKLAVLRLRRLLHRIRPDACIAHGNRAVRLLQAAGAWPLIGVLPNYKMHCRGLAAAFHSTQDLGRFALSQGLAQDQVHHIPNMVRVPPPGPRRTRHDPPVIGSMGRFVAKKGFDGWLASLGLLAQRGIAFRAILGGDGPEAAALHRSAAAHGLTDRISFPGWVQDKRGFFDSIDLFCLPSLHEPFGIVLLEALAHALPVVTTASEGPSEIVRHDQEALVVPVGDAGAMAAALQVLLGDAALAERLADSGYRLVRAVYDLPRVAERLDTALRDVVARAPPR